MNQILSNITIEQFKKWLQVAQDSPMKLEGLKKANGLLKRND